METENMENPEVGGVTCRGKLGKGNKMNSFVEMVNDSEDYCVAFRGR